MVIGQLQEVGLQELTHSSIDLPRQIPIPASPGSLTIITIDSMTNLPMIAGFPARNKTARELFPVVGPD